jgi:hypothetical protein
LPRPDRQVYTTSSLGTQTPGRLAAYPANMETN